MTAHAQLLVYRFIAGIGSTTVITGTQIVVADVATRANRGRMMSTYQGFFHIVQHFIVDGIFASNGLCNFGKEVFFCFLQALIKTLLFFFTKDFVKQTHVT